MIIFSLVNSFLISASTGIDVIPYIENKNSQNTVLLMSEKVDIRKQNVRNYMIPSIINYLYPKLKYEEYSKMKTENVFNSKSALVCENCFLEITKFCNIIGTNTQNLLRHLKPFKGNIYTMNKNKIIKQFMSKIEKKSTKIIYCKDNLKKILNNKIGTDLANKTNKFDSIHNEQITFTNQMFCKSKD